MVKASNDNDLVEVTSQACGIPGYGNTTVKLTKQQYQNLEQYLVDFRAKLNQTTTKEEAIPIFKDAVVELNKYGLLPKGMSVEKAQNLVIGGFQNPRFLRFLDDILKRFLGTNYGAYENYNCLISGQTTYTVSVGPILSTIEYSSALLATIFYDTANYYHLKGNVLLSDFFEWLSWQISAIFLFGSLINVIDNLNPVTLLSIIGLGTLLANPGYGWHNYPANGWIHTNGLNGVKNWSGDIYGNLTENYIISWLWVFECYPGVFGFSGIKIGITESLNSFYLGHAIKVKIRG